jgi:peptidoglycan/LPS O-acetylase OafA/YrhL
VTITSEPTCVGKAPSASLRPKPTPYPLAATPREPVQQPPKRATWRYVPALDGLRGLAVAAVVLYHAGLSWLPGGLLGVDTFFVLSGFLITGLLLAERRRSGRIDLRRFWERRARRLLPALLLLIVLVSVLVSTTGTAAQQERYPKDAFSALFYVANWRFAFSHQGYFGADAPSPLLHLWSLGIEEQFYLLWPVVLLLALRRGVRASRRVAWCSFGLALLSAGWMAVAAGVLHLSDDRLYYGTDTHAAALLIGASLAALRARHALPRPSAAPSRVSPLLSRAGLSLAGLVGFVVMITMWATARGQSPWLYRGGFLVMAIAVAAVLAAVCSQPRAGLARLLSLPPLVALGNISYGVYLFHWPLFLLLDHQHTGLSGANLLFARLAATLTLAAASYLLVEEPIRRGRVRLPRARIAVPLVAGLVGAAIATVGLLPPAQPQDFSAAPAKLQEVANRLVWPGARPSTQAAKTLASQTKTVGPAADPVRMLIVGDSIGFSAAWALAAERQTYRVDLQSDSVIGCGIVPLPYANPNASSPVPLSSCLGWQTTWADTVTRFRPAISAVFLGRWEITDRVQNGATVHIGQPAYDAALSGLLDQAIDVLSAHSGKVALVALPCFTVQELADGSSAEPEAVARTALYNQLLVAAASRHPTVASVLDLNPQICPGGHVSSTYRGSPLRDADGLHFDLRSGPALGPLLLAPLRRLAGAAG